MTSAIRRFRKRDAYPIPGEVSKIMKPTNGSGRSLLWRVTIWCLAASVVVAAEKNTGVLDVTVTEKRAILEARILFSQSEIEHRKSNIEPLPCRVHLTANGRPIYAPGCPRWERDADFCCDGRFRVEAPAGKVELLVERGPEWESHAETLEIEPGTTRTVEVRLSRWIDMNARGWYGGDLHVHRPLADLPLLMRAEDLNVAPVLTQWNAQNMAVEPPYLVKVEDRATTTPRYYHTLNQEDERIGGAILLFNLRRSIAIENVYRYWPSGMAYHRAALEQNDRVGLQGQVANRSHVEQEKPFWWEAPVHVALGKVSTMGIVHNHFQRRDIMDSEAWGRPRDREQYPGQMGFCLYTLDLYYRYLNLGWDIPVSAGSASGVLANPLGYNRVYVQMDRFDYEGWFEMLRAGRSFATNGPMLFATVNGRPIGTHFNSEADKPFEATVRLEVLCREPLDRAEIVVGGTVVATFHPQASDLKQIVGEHRLSVERSAWIAVRAFQRYKPTLRFAHTSPFYVAVGGAERRDPEAAQFYIQWLDDLIAQMEKDREHFQNARHLAKVLETYKQARDVYAKRANRKASK